MDDSKLEGGALSYVLTRLEIPVVKEVKLKEKDWSYNASISSVESIAKLKIDNVLKVDLRVEITKSRWDGNDFVEKQEKKVIVKGGKTLHLKSIFKHH